MIRLIFCDTGALPYSTAIKKVAEIPALSGIVEGGCEKRARDSAAAYILLKHALPALFGCECRTVKRSESGKPYIEGSEVDFSISHRDGVCLLALSNEGAVGADVEEIKCPERMGRINERYLSALDFSEASGLNVEIYFALLSADGEVVNLDKIRGNDNKGLQITEINVPKNPFSKWTVLESVLKLDGGGFGAIGRAGELISTSRIYTAEVNYRGAEYAISVAALA